MRHAIPLIIVSIAVLTPSVHAQVFKCKDAHGRVMYSDTGCTSMQQGHKIEREKSMEEKYQERAQAYLAQQDKHARQLREQEREIQERQYQAMRATSAPSEIAAPGHKGYAERLQERNAGVQSTLAPPKLADSRSSGQRSTTNTARAPSFAAPQAPTHLNCKGSWCNDGQGGAYSRSANGRFLNGPAGKTCSMSANGKWANCH